MAGNETEWGFETWGDVGRVADMMANKAACAWANLVWLRREREELVAKNGESEWWLRVAELSSEYEATIRCLDMLVKTPMHELCETVIYPTDETGGLTLP